MRSPTRVLVVGFDAMDADIARAMAARGLLPTLTSLLGSAASAETRNPVGLLVGGLWPSFSTAVSPARHGFYAFRQLIPGRDEVGRFDPHDIRHPPFWKVLSKAGRRCAVIDVPITPVTVGIRGMHVVDWGSHDRMLPFETSPPELTEEILHTVGPHPIVGKCDDYAVRRDHAGLRDALLAGVEAKTRLAEDVLTQGEWDLFITVFGESHCAGHHFWHLHDHHHPDHDATTVTRLGAPLEDVYRALDSALARLLRLVGDDAVVMLLLSHGIGPHFDGEHLLTEVLARLEHAYGDPPRHVVLRERVRRFARRVRRVLRPPERRGVVSIDASRRFVHIPNNEYWGAVRFNVKGRDPHGRVASGPELDALATRLERDLRALVNADTGEPVVREVIHADDVYERDPLDGLPDLFLEWDKRGPITGIRSPIVGTIAGQSTSPRTGDHRPPGLMLLRGPGVNPGPLDGPVPVTDLAPTIAAMLGVELTDVEGRPIDALVAASTAHASAPHR
jgi:predicted AlkP superfamily phosphohydrolase/phosphomutase